ncbi:MAG: hypothetical protein ABI830_11000 [Pseudolabrys sp.]
MILVAGGQLDFNIGALLQRMLRRRVKFVSVLLGPDLMPRLTVDVAKDTLVLNGKAIRPRACFMRHDVFLAQQVATADAHAASLNWYVAIKGWELAHDDVRGFNKKSSGAEANKLRNLYLARQHGLDIPATLLTNEFKPLRKKMRGPLIVKPAGGGEHTEEFGSFAASLSTRTPMVRYPRFVQRRMLRPELRVYRVGDALFGFALSSPDIGYRSANRARLKTARVPGALGRKLTSFCDALGLDFAAADFMRDPETRDFRFLEVNSQPMFAAFDKVSGGRLCDAIIDHLSRG